MKNRRFWGILSFFYIVLCAVSLFAQSRLPAQRGAVSSDKKNRPVHIDGKELPPSLYINPSPEALPAGYRSIVLGMDFEAVKDALQKDGLFGYRGERDVSLLPGENRVLIETSSAGYLARCWFQFYENKLYTIIINFNPEKIDFYSVLTELLKKYGEPASLSPETVYWQNADISLNLERPVSLKYMDMRVFNALADKSSVEESAAEILRSHILDAL